MSDSWVIMLCREALESAQPDVIPDKRPASAMAHTLGVHAPRPSQSAAMASTAGRAPRRRARARPSPSRDELEYCERRMEGEAGDVASSAPAQSRESIAASGTARRRTRACDDRASMVA